MSEHMGNDMNFLCPRCKKGTELRVMAFVQCHLTPEGSDVEGDHEWNQDSAAMCKGGAQACNWIGHVSDLIKIEEGEGKIVACADCETEWYENQTEEVDNISDRFITGDTYTEHQCPACGALCYPLGGK
jgi:predicted RNA-binding Zn-ribbon protein involved in translation (DUF1610 family)